MCLPPLSSLPPHPISQITSETIHTDDQNTHLISTFPTELSRTSLVQAQPFPARRSMNLSSPDTAVTYVKTSNPHPAKAVKSLGLRSRAGFMAQPLFSPKEEAMTIIRRPMAMGSKPLGTPKFLESKMAKTTMRRNMVATTCRGRKCTRDLTCTLLPCPPQNSPPLVKNKPGNN